MRGRGRVAQVLLAGCVAALVLLDIAAIAGELRAFINSDTAWIQVMARRVLAGERLYVHTLEINPPLIVWLNLPAAWLERVFGISAVVAARFAAFAGIALSTAATVRLLDGDSPKLQHRRWPAAVLLASVLIALPMGAFTEREQLITLGLMPLGALTVVRLRGGTVVKWLAAAVGVAAGLGIALKPQYLPCWLLLVALRTAAPGRLRFVPEDVALVAVGVVYVAAVGLLAPEFFTMALRFGGSYAEFTARSRQRIIFGSPETYWWLAAALAWWVRRPARADPVGRVLMALCLGCFAAVVLQGKGWLYHFLPLSTFTMLLAAHAAGLSTPPETRTLPRLARVFALALLVLIFAPLVVRTARINWERARGRTERREEIAALLELLRTQRGARTIEVLSSDITPVFPLVHLAGLTEHMSMPHLWLPMVVYRSQREPWKPMAINAPSRMGQPERLAFDAVAADIRRGSDLLLVESQVRNEQRSGYPGGFDHLAYYAQDPGVRARLRQYRAAGESHGYQLFARLDTVPRSGNR